MTPIRWLLTILSFAATIGVSLYMVFGWSQQGATLTLPPKAHLLAAAAVAVEVLARALKIRWSAQAAGGASAPNHSRNEPRPSRLLISLTELSTLIDAVTGRWSGKRISIRHRRSAST